MKFSCLNRKRFLALLVLSFYLLSPVASWACTSIIVGKNASVTGRAMIARTADSGITSSRKFIVVPAGFYSAGEHVLQANGFKFTFTHPSYKYTAVPNTTRRGIDDGSLGTNATSKDLVPHWEDGFAFTHDSCGVNEKGLAVSATNTTGIRSGIGMTSGTNLWQEPTMAKVLLSQAANCKEAMDAIDTILASGQGMGAEVIQIADQNNEAWMIEAIGRHNYVASRVPDDSFGIIANDMRTQFFDVNDKANFRSNPGFDPVQHAITNGFARYQVDENGVKRVNITLSYGPAVNGDGNTYRVWRGMTMFAPSQGSKIKLLTNADYYGGGGTNATSEDINTANPIAKTYPTYIKPDKKISPMDVTWMQRDRYAGTTFDATYSPQYLNANGIDQLEGSGVGSVATVSPPGSPITTWIRPIGHTTHRMTHVFEVGPDFPPEIGARFFLGMGPLETGVSLPFYGNITDTHPTHKRDITSVNGLTSGNGAYGNSSVPYFDPNMAFMLFARLGYLARADRVNYVAPIQEFWRNYELKLYEDQEKVIEPEILRLNKTDKAASAKFATDYTIAVSDKAFRTAIKIHDALVAHIAANPYTLFKIPAELLETVVNDTVLRDPTSEDKKAVVEAGGNNLLIRDEGNIQVGVANASYAPDVSGCKYDLDGTEVSITLTPEQIAAYQTAAKLLYEVEIDNDIIKAYGGLENLKKNLTLVMSANGKTLEAVGTGSDALISFADALDNGMATLVMTSTGAIVGLDFILIDGTGVSGIYNDRIVVFDGVKNGELKGSIWLATNKSDEDDCSGCDAGFAFAAAGLLAALVFMRKRSK